MAGHGSQRQPTDTKGMLRRMQKDALYEARRSVPHTASDLLGPGIASRAVRTQDWNADELAFNGLFYSEPGAQNSPDPARYWMGLVEITAAGHGIHRVWEYRSPADPTLAPLERVRLVTTTGVSRTYGAWLDPFALSVLTTDSDQVPFARAAGIVSVSASALAVGGVVLFAVTFPASRFTQAPVVVCDLQNATGGSASAAVRPTAITSSGFSVALYNQHPTSAMTFAATNVGWTAQQALSGSAID